MVTIYWEKYYKEKCTYKIRKHFLTQKIIEYSDMAIFSKIIWFAVVDVPAGYIGLEPLASKFNWITFFFCLTEIKHNYILPNTPTSVYDSSV